MINILNKYWNNPTKTQNFKGYYDIEIKQKAGISREKAVKISTYLKHNNQFGALIDKMDFPNSSIECKNLDLTI